jgi:hypothetical protein
MSKELAFDTFIKHIPLFEEKGSYDFRTTVIRDLMEMTGASLSSASTLYNNAKKRAEETGICPAGLGRKKSDSTTKSKSVNKAKEIVYDDSSCFTVLELIENYVCRTRSFGSDQEEEAREHLRSRRACNSTEWKLIKGLGPNAGAEYKLAEGEEELA